MTIGKKLTIGISACLLIGIIAGVTHTSVWVPITMGGLVGIILSRL